MVTYYVALPFVRLENGGLAAVCRPNAEIGSTKHGRGARSGDRESCPPAGT
jgi:hypothetical protein